MIVLPIDFVGQGALLEPVDRNLHDLAVDYCQREILTPVDFAKLAKTWVAVDDGKVHGVMGYVLRPDIPVIRATDERALSMMAERLQSFFADQGWRGGDVFVHISKAEKPEQRCAGWKSVLISEQKAEPADRFRIKVR